MNVNQLYLLYTAEYNEYIAHILVHIQRKWSNLNNHQIERANSTILN